MNRTPEETLRGGCRRPAGWVFAVLLALACGGCGHLFFPSSQPKAQVGSLKAAAGEPVSMSLLEVEVMRFADSYATPDGTGGR